MNKLIIYLLLISPFIVFGQNEYLAQNYLDKGEFDKAIIIYDELLKAQPNNASFFQKVILCNQQLKAFDKAEILLKDKLEKTKAPTIYIELGYNYQLQNITDKAQKNYLLAIEKLKDNPNYLSVVAKNFESKMLLQQAIDAYLLVQKINPNSNFDYPIALLQGQLGQTEQMINTLVDYAFIHPENLMVVQNQLDRFLQEDTNKSFAEYLKKALLLRTQKSQDLFWNKFMSWYYVQNKEYGKAFIQEKAIYKRNPDDYQNIAELSEMAIAEKETETAKEILQFLIQNVTQSAMQIQVNQQWIALEIAQAAPKDYPALSTKLQELLQKFGNTPATLDLQITKAHFDAFYTKNTALAITNLKQALELPLDNYQIAQVKMELADILVVEQKFNQAIIYYAQVESTLENNEMAHQASLKMAKTSYYKGDLEWAQKQFKVLKASTSQLIANDALELFLLIHDATAQDSTQVALRKFSQADFYLYQNKNTEALQQFELILQGTQQKSIQEVALLRIGKIHEKQNNLTQALSYYQQIIDNYTQGIYIDEAYYFSAQIYQKQMLDSIKAKQYYEQIVLKHPDSIYFVEARNNYRKLRGDTN